jgi:hypothetical protein
MRRRVQIGAQRDFDDRHVGIRQHQHERDEDAVVQPTLGVLARCQPGPFEQAAHPLRECGRAGRRVLQVVGVLGKAVVVEQERRVGGGVDGETAGFPVAGDDHHGFGLFGQRGDQAAQKRSHRLPHAGGAARVLHEEARPAAVRKVERGLTGGGVHHDQKIKGFAVIHPERYS